MNGPVGIEMVRSTRTTGRYGILSVHDFIVRSRHVNPASYCSALRLHTSVGGKRQAGVKLGIPKGGLGKRTSAMVAELDSRPAACEYRAP